MVNKYTVIMPRVISILETGNVVYLISYYFEVWISWNFMFFLKERVGFTSFLCNTFFFPLDTLIKSYFVIIWESRPITLFTQPRNVPPTMGMGFFFVLQISANQIKGVRQQSKGYRDLKLLNYSLRKGESSPREYFPRVLQEFWFF